MRFQDGSNKVAIEIWVVQSWSEIILVISNRTRALKSRAWFQTKLLIRWIAIYAVDNATQPSNNRGQVSTKCSSDIWRFEEIPKNENLIRKFFHPITITNRLSRTWGKPFHPIRNQLSEWIGHDQFVNAFTLFLAPLQSSFTEVCRVSTSLLKFSRKFE